MTTQKLEYVTFDVFTKTRYLGNPLAIVKVPASVTLSQDQKQLIAREFNYSESVILHEHEADSTQWDIDIFLTTAEIPFAGHPTIGTTCFLGARLAAINAAGVTKPARGTVVTKAGPIPFTYDPVSQTSHVEVPHDVHLHARTLSTASAQWHGLSTGVIEGFARPPAIVSAVRGMTFVLTELSSLAALAQVEAAYKEVSTEIRQGLEKPWHPDGGLVGFTFYVRNGVAEDGTLLFRTRMILGNLEDPATGSASCALAAYLAVLDKKAIQTGSKTAKFKFVQAVEMGRESHIYLQVTPNADGTAVDKMIMGGSAVQVMEGRLDI